MLLSTETKSLRKRVGDEAAIDIIAEAGFDALDYTFDEMCDEANILNTDGCDAYIARLQKRAEQAGLRFRQAHAPFLFDWEDEDAYEKWILPTVIRSIELAARLGAPHIVVHPIHHLVYAENVPLLWDINRRYFKALLPYAKQYGIRLALENMFQVDPLLQCPIPDMFADPAELIRFLDEMGDDTLVVCVDVGHAGLAGENAAHSLRMLGNRVKALHIHDNDFLSDQHLPPFLGKIDWDAVTRALSEIGYEGDFTFEAANFYQGFDRELLPAAARFLQEIGRYFINRISH